MRKQIKTTEAIFPMPVLMIATYNEDGTVDVMNAAWGTMFERDEVILNLTESHKTVKNIRKRKAFTVSIANSKNVIEVYYDNQKLKLEIPLNKDERFIRSYRYINIDATVIEILPKDNVDDKFFLSPNLDYINGYEQFEGQEIYIPQFPGEKKLSFSLGKIKLIILKILLITN